MKRTVLTLVAAVLLTLLPGRLVAQTEPAERSVTHELRLRDGSRVYGHIASESDTEVVFETAAGVLLTARRDQIVSLRPIKGQMMSGEFQPADPNNTRLFFGPTGRSLAKGQTYLGIYEFFMPFVQVGVTDRFSIGGGTPLVFGFEGWDRPFWITPKLRVFSNRTTDVSVGLFHGFAGSEGGGIAYGVATAGDPAASVTAGVGFGYNNEGGRAWVVMGGGDRQFRRNMKVVSENYLWEGGDGVVSAGIRFFGDRLSADLALAMPIGNQSGGGFLFPVLNFVFLF